MTTYTAIPNSDVDADSPVTTGLMTLLRDNPLAISEGSTGAPKIQTAAYDTGSVDAAAIAADAVTQSELADDAVGQGELKSSFDFLGNAQAFTSSGGAFSLGWESQRHNTEDRSMAMFHASGADESAYTARWNFTASITSNDNARLYYVQSSPPYDLGDGDVPLFVSAQVDNGSGEIGAIHIAPDPTWCNNGPTNVTPSRIAKDGRAFRKRRDMSAHPFTWIQASQQGRAAIQAYIEAFHAAEIIEEEITQEIKNADMDIIYCGSPYALNTDLADKTVVLLDPVSDILAGIADMMKHYDDGFDPADLIRNYLVIGNSQLNRSGPPGVLIPSIKWKKSK